MIIVVSQRMVDDIKVMLGALSELPSWIVPEPQPRLTEPHKHKRMRVTRHDELLRAPWQ